MPLCILGIMKKLFLLLMCGAILLVSSHASAQIFVEQGKVEHDVQPGETISDKIFVHNTSEKTISLDIYWEDFEYQSPFDGSKKFLPPGTSSLSASNWVKFSPINAVIEPYGKKEIAYTINVPADAKGGFYGVLFFEKDPVESEFQRGLSIVTRVGTLFFIETTTKTKSIEWAGVQVLDHKISGALINKGDVIAIPDGVYYVMDKEGLVVDRGSIDKVYLPAGQEVDYGLTLSDQLPSGAYTIVLTMDLQDGDVLVREIDVQKDAYSQIDVLEIRE